MERQVRIKNTISNDWETHTVNATTFGELQEELGNTYSDNKVIVRETKTTLDLKGAKLPDGDFTLFIMPKRTKAGLTKTEVEDMGHNDLRRVSKEKDLPAVYVSSSEMRDNLYRWIEENEAEVSTSKEDVIALLEQAIEKIRGLDAEENSDYLEIIERDFERVRAELGV